MEEFLEYLLFKGIVRIEIDIAPSFCRITDSGECPTWVVEKGSVIEAETYIRAQLEANGSIKTVYG